MKNALTLLLFLLSSIVSYSQTIYDVYPKESRRGEKVSFDIEGYATHFTGSSSFTVSFKSNVDGSVFSSTGFWAMGDTYLSGSMTVPEDATSGLYSVSIQTFNEGRLILGNAFTISNLPPLPKFIKHTPTIAANGEQVNMTITVRNAGFMSTSNLTVTLVGINGSTHIPATSVVPINDSTITAIINIPEHHRTDLCNLYITTDNERIASPPYSFTISGIQAQIVWISPDMASDGDHVDITIHGSETFFTDGGSGGLDVMLQGKAASDTLRATSVTAVNDTVLIASFDIPLYARLRVYDVIVYRPGGFITIQDEFTINGTNPQLETVSPSEVTQGETRDIIISGVDMYFNDTSNFDIVFWGDQGDFSPVSPPVVLNDNQIKVTITVPASAILGFYDLLMANEKEHFYFEGAIKVLDDGNPSPKLVSITPKVAERGQSLDIIITGTNSHFTQTSDLKVTLTGDNNYYRASSITVISDTELKCHFDFPSNAFSDIYDLYVVDVPSQHYLSLGQVFTINGSTFDPRLVTISPAMTFPGQVLDITIKGANTHFMDSSSNLDMAIYSQETHVEPTGFVATSNTEIVAHFEIPDDFPLGVYDFGLVSDIDGNLQLHHFVIVNAVGLDESTDVVSNLYPNPVHDKLYIDTKYPVRACTIVDITGKQTMVDPNEFKQDNTHIIVPIDKLGLRKGIYFIRLESDSGFDYKKFIVE